MIFDADRLYLREMIISDAEEIYLLNLDEEVIRYTGDVPFDNIAQAKEFIFNYDHYRKYGMGRWAVIRKTDEAFLGWCGLKYSPEVDEYDIGYRLMKKHWGKGYATEAAKACIKWAFEKTDIQEIVGRARVENISSYKVLEKIGLKYWKTRNSEEGDLLIYKVNKLERTT